MTPEAQRIAIAQACGKCTCKTYKQTGDWGTAVCDECGRNPYHASHNLAGYLADLNAMNAAEATLTPEQQEQYGSYLWDATVGKPEGGFRLIHADAPARACAFLRVLDLWTD